MAVVLFQRPVISQGDVDFPAVDYTGYLDADELLTGTPTVVSLGKVASYESDGTPVYAANSDLSFSNKAVNIAAIPIMKKIVAIGKAVQFGVSGQLKGNTYGVSVTATTDSSPARTKAVEALLVTAK